MDELRLVRQLRRSEAPPEGFLEAERAKLMDTITQAPPAMATTRRRRWWVAPAVAAVSLAAAAAGWAVTRDAGQSTAVSCNAHVINATSGDPVADCRREWRALYGEEPPALAAYDNGVGAIEVVPAGTDVPEGWRLVEGAAQDRRLIGLERSLGDVVDGLGQACLDTTAARPVVEAALRANGLEGWRIDEDRGEADGETTCAHHVVDAPEQTVELFPLEGSEPDASIPGVALAAELREVRDGGSCLSSAEALRAARDAAASLGMTEAARHVTLASVPGGRCADFDVVIGGRVEVTVRGG